MCADSYGLAEAVSHFGAKEKAELKQRLDLHPGLTFLFVGQMVERKGIKELLQAWGQHIANHPQDNLIVIGKGILLDALKERYEGESSIHVLGGIDYDLLYQYYALCDVFVMPTLEDNWCLVVPEAMACRKPVACSIYNGGHYELVKDGVNGYNFDPLQQNSIVETLNKFHHADLNTMGEMSVEIESNYTPDKAAQRIFDACKKTFEER